jgi:23S rRNA pseudouridine1911/1915/1917 synthase
MNKKNKSNQRILSYNLKLLYEDRDIIVVDKPAGLLSVASGSERDKTVYWLLCEYLRKKGEKRRPAVVHRLDRDTSGIMLFAKSEQVKRYFMDDWNNKIIRRRYLAIVEGVIIEKSGVLDQDLGEDAGGRVIVKPGGKSAITHWTLLRTGAKHSLISAELETGRRNQIRAHFAHFKHPVAGDKKYNARTNPLNRLALHAENIVFHHKGSILEFSSPVDWKV